MNKKQIIALLFSCLLLATFYLLPVGSVFADYVLPYPSYMPGNKMYTVSRMIDKIKKYWYWGSIGGMKYHLSLSDKYLVEAKTLFEYKQYLLAADALLRSNKEFQEVPRFLVQAKDEGKDTSVLEQTVKDAGNVHISVLEVLKAQLPAEFTWTPEKTAPTILPISTLIDTSIKIRGHARDSRN